MEVVSLVSSVSLFDRVNESEGKMMVIRMYMLMNKYFSNTPSLTSKIHELDFLSRSSFLIPSIPYMSLKNALVFIVLVNRFIKHGR